ncbi:MAG: hypothetical protein LBN39_06035, partial [Planctomycetaceae bacterium]|nr:hypothetical protein [Planctomycetaceae bacterium]
MTCKLFMAIIFVFTLTLGLLYAADSLDGPVKDVESTAKLLPEFPQFEYKGIVLGYENLKFKPHDDICFVGVFKAYEHFEKPLGKYYMYYAAHDTPAEIALAYADKLEGPWTEYENNPVIRRN